MDKNHLVLRAYIAAARNEHYTPDHYTRDQCWTDLKADIFENEPWEMGMIEWDEPQKIAQLIYKVYGYTASQQFDRCIIAQPGYIENLLICSSLRKAFGDISSVPGFDAKGNFHRERYNDILMAQFDGKKIVGLVASSSRALAKELASAIIL